MAYLRIIPDRGDEQILIANSDGAGEQIIFHRPTGVTGFTSDPSWSASGDLIAVAALDLAKNTLTSILVLSPEGKLVKSFPSDKLITALAWLPDASGLVFIGGEKSTGLRYQVWFQPYPSGDAFKISNDFNRYASVSVAADGKSFVTTQARPAATIYVGDSPSVLNSRIEWKLMPVSTEQVRTSLAWTASGKLVEADGANRLLLAAADGSSATHMTPGDELFFNPAACGEGDVVVLNRLSEENAPNLWRLNAATGDLRQLTSGKSDENPSCTPDGKWMVYVGSSPKDNVGHIFKLSTDGGTPVELAHGTVGAPTVSPDGQFVAYVRIDGQGASAKSKFIVQRLEAEKLEGGAPIQQIDAPADNGSLEWTPDGHGLTYLHTVGSARHLYLQQLTGGPPIQLTHFDTEPSLIASYGWSRDGKKIAITRARYNDTDVVMFSGFR
jgi:Tol biopolymer transport system component